MDLLDVTIIISDSSDYLIAFTAIMALITYSISKFFKLLFWYCAVISVLTVSSTILAMYGANNWYLYHALGLAELIFGYFLYQSLGLHRAWGKIFIGLALLYVCSSVYVIYSDISLLMESPEAEVYFENSLGMSLSTFSIILLGINFLYSLYKSERVRDLGRYPYFYISAGFTVLAAGSFFFYLLISLIISEDKDDQTFLYSWIIVSCLTVIKYSLILLGLWQAKKWKMNLQSY